MKVLILTNEYHINFIFKTIEGIPNSEHDFLIKCYGEFDWSEDYDIGISFMYQHKVPKEQIDTHTWINFHPAPLPEYKGRNLCYHAIMNGEKEFGTTVHYMDENFDTGDIIDCLKFSILLGDSANDVSDFAMKQSQAQFQVYFPLILAGEEFERLPNVGGTYYTKMPISDEIYVSDETKKQIRSITYGDFYPKIDIGGVTYKIVKDE